MSEESHFNKALSDFTYDMACGSSIRHMTDKGYTVKQIAERLDYPAPYAKIQKTVYSRLCEKGILLSKEPDFSDAKTEVRYILERDRFGHSSFRKVSENKTLPLAASALKSLHFTLGNVETLGQFLSRKVRENGTEYSYISCDFGMYEKDHKIYEYLNSRQKEYVEGILWPKKRMYHRLDYRMIEIAIKLSACDDYEMICYFGKTGEKITL